MCDVTHTRCLHVGSNRLWCHYRCPLSSFLCVTWLIHMCDMTHSYVWHDSFLCVTWRIHMCGMTHSYVWYDSFICVIWIMHMCDMMHSCVWHDSLICVTWLIRICDMTHSYAWHDSFICVIRLIHMCDFTHFYVWHDSCICVTWLIYKCDMSHWFVWHDSYAAHNYRVAMVMSHISCHTYEWVMSHIWMSHVTNMNESCHIFLSNVWHDSFICVTSYAVHNHCVTHMNKLCRTFERKTRDTFSFINVTRPIHMCDMTHLSMWHDSYAAHNYRVTHLKWKLGGHDSFICVTWLIHICDMTHL